MKIVADQNIPEVKSAFAPHGEVVLVNGRNLAPDQVTDADALIVRSVTKVNGDLLRGSNVRFVGSATIGMDHVDQQYLADNNIFFTSAPGCNAVSAAEYVATAVLHVAEKEKFEITGLKAGIVGYGNVGSRTAKRLAALGCEVRVYDPPREHQYHDRDYATWDAICDCDLVSAHVPLTRDGDYPTYHMFNQAFFAALKDNALFINTSRGSAVDETALMQRINSAHPLRLVLDVWQNEPNIDLELMEHTLIASPHIAGYSREGKFRGLQMIYEAACQYFNWQPAWSMQRVLPPLDRELTVDSTQPVQHALHELVAIAYDLPRDDRDMRMIINKPVTERADYFDNLRKNYPERREFFNYQLKETSENRHITSIAEQLGFTILR